ncbi:MAG: hypoxanthine phosphoribosyltransferase [Candidatus Rokubacteria bacterium RIFCSPLOWO2_02_FULL_68_19]|nr:MAG: hypoxanthine phosphoribosyltransferase [Candidatus Rokubacteria bacterium RIFCSPHIGHO2_02_FULL_69_13]OGL04415.1 MAG: hypoxanthine phosphoribosyltransferase [Candidatus Rokubacteria bacterium RIFCSPLOWO2_02_FULL_68_19]
MSLYDDLEAILLDADAIQAEVRRLGERISKDFADRHPHLIGVLKGSSVFLSDLMRTLTVPVTVDYIWISPYETPTPSGVVRIRKDLDDPIEGRDVIVVEGIIDTGLTLSYLLRNFRTRNPASLKVCAFVNKRAQRIIDLSVDYVGREIPDKFVVGYGLDYRQRYRNLPVLGVLKPSALD